MKNKGEFYKRLWQIFTYDFKMDDEIAERMQDKLNFNVRAVMKVVEDMNREFPKLSSYPELKGLTDKHEKTLAKTFPIVMAQIGVERGKWFRKYFSE